MRLFKFVGSVNAVLNMAKGGLKFTPIEELNDPSELTPVFDRPAVRASLKALRKNGMTREQFKWLQMQGALLDLLSPEEKTFDGDESGSLNVIKPVVYSDRFVGMTFDPSTQDRLFFCKLSDWSYEREWRVVTALNSCRRSQDRALYLRDIDPLHLTGVICGWRVSEDVRSQLLAELTCFKSTAQLISATLNASTVTLNPPLE